MKALTAFFAAAATLGAASAASLQPVDLRCEYLRNPLGIDELRPRLSWKLSSERPAAKQSAYRILVASSGRALASDQGDLWDTGRVNSEQSIQVEYAGAPLKSGMDAFWKVQVWDENGQASGWSAPFAHWSMGLLSPSDWKGKWIGRDELHLRKDPRSPFHLLDSAKWIWGPEGTGPMVYRKTITLPQDSQIRQAVAVMGADPEFTLDVNGERVGKGTYVYMPERFDIRPYLKPGDNQIVVTATRADKGKLSGFIGAIRIEFASGAPLMVTTGGDWTGAAGSGAYGMKPWGEVGFFEERALPARYLRKEFDAMKAVRRATVYVSGLGLFELYVNGTRAGHDALAPGLTDYDKRVQYVVYDVTKQVAPGRNGIGVILGNGRYWAPRQGAPIDTRSFGYPKLLLQLEIEYADGTRSTVVSDESWRLTTNGPILANNEYDGEVYDAKLEMPGWDKAGYNDSSWQAAAVVGAPAGKLVPRMTPPIEVTQTLKVQSVKEPKPGVYVLDLGQNIVGWTRLKVEAPKGTEIRLRHAETLRPDGMLYVDNLRTARATDVYTTKGKGVETWEPRFTYHGFRYVEITNWPGKPGPEAIEGLVVHDALDLAGTWSSSNPLLNQIANNIRWGIRGNYRSIPTDCPQRDERQGWLGDRSVVSRSESYLFNVAPFYTKWVTDIADSQKPNGAIPDVAPNYWTMYNDDVTWPSTFLLAPGMVLDQYGDTRIIERNYPVMKLWLDHMRGYIKDGLLAKDTYADWCVPPESPELIHSKDPARVTKGALLASAYFIEILKRMAEYARIAKKDSDAVEYEALATRMAAAFQQKYFSPSTGLYDNGTQTSSILPLAFGIAPPDARAKLFQSLVTRIGSESNNHVGTGLIGAQWLMRTLSDNGRPDLAYTIATQTTYPGWGYMVSKGATTVWELWNGDTADPAMNSGNHVMQIGDLNVWLYEYLAGIRSDPKQPGFKHLFIRPTPVKGLEWVRASHESMYGTITSAWRRSGDKVLLDISIPPNSTATVYTSPGAFVEVGSGRHSFTLTGY